MKKPGRFLFAAIALFIAAPLLADLPPLIPREVLFGNPERANPQLSPDAKRLAWLAPDKKNVLQVWVKTIGKDDDKIVTADKKRGIRSYFWAPDDRTLLYIQDNDGDENFHVYGVDLDAGTVRDYTAYQGVRAAVIAVEPEIPNEVLVQMNARDRHVFDVYRLSLDSGALTLDTKNPGDVSGWGVDKKLNVLAGFVTTPEGGTEIRIRDNRRRQSRLHRNLHRQRYDQARSKGSRNRSGNADCNVGRSRCRHRSDESEDARGRSGLL